MVYDKKKGNVIIKTVSNRVESKVRNGKKRETDIYMYMSCTLHEIIILYLYICIYVINLETHTDRSDGRY